MDNDAINSHMVTGISRAVGVISGESLGSILNIRSRAPNINLLHLSFWISSRAIYFVYGRKFYSLLKFYELTFYLLKLQIQKSRSF